MAIKDGLVEYKDSKNENRLRVHSKGRIIVASTEGYKNLSAMRDAAISGAIMVLENYSQLVTEEQKTRLSVVILDKV